MQSYSDALQQGKAQWVDQDPPVEIVRHLLDQLAHRDRKELLDKRAPLDKHTHQRTLKIDREHTLDLLAGQRDTIAEFMPTFAEQYLAAQQAKPELFQQLDGIQRVNPEFFNLLDAARRISGGGSLGLDSRISRSVCHHCHCQQR